MEQYPETVRNQNEECIRALFLAQLNATFTSLATTGESFNHNGKTDIMIKHNGSIIFIAECKIWKGEKAFLEAINQLLSYLTWRDSKTSLLVFVKQTNISTIINTLHLGISTRLTFFMLISFWKWFLTLLTYFILHRLL